ncbi:MAG: hypothetical protein WBW37_05885 [Methyloceanibacter sp.]
MRRGTLFAQRNSLPAILEPSGYDRWLDVTANDDVANLNARE